MGKISIIGQKFGRLTVVCFTGKNSYKRDTYQCLCDCGIEKIIVGASLKNGLTRSCGCLLKGRKKETFPQQGFSRHGADTRQFYDAWHNSVYKCRSSNHPSYSWYGDRGIKVCDRWLEFKNFRDDMYSSYLLHLQLFSKKDTTLERINNDGNYEPSNCKWATRAEQARNMSDSVKSKNYQYHVIIRHRLHSKLFRALKYRNKTSSITNYLGCSLVEFRTYIENKFLPGMNWDTWGRGIGRWALDHIKPCHDFDLSIEEDQKKCFHYTNLQPLWEIDNLRKH